jgi:hypothetical protein
MHTVISCTYVARWLNARHFVEFHALLPFSAGALAGLGTDKLERRKAAGAAIVAWD